MSELDPRRLPEKTPEYVRNYNRGWYATGTIEFADGIDDDAEREAWLDGKSDSYAGREKWHLTTCRFHHNREGGCGKA